MQSLMHVQRQAMSSTHRLAAQRGLVLVPRMQQPVIARNLSTSSRSKATPKSIRDNSMIMRHKSSEPEQPKEEQVKVCTTV